ncbi:MAG: hypothetical protein M3O15_15135, partial [Acidobacteriota bacterium]|nr:hypothetical protein [Acidobacteriota bacterium]
MATFRRGTLVLMLGSGAAGLWGGPRAPGDLPAERGGQVVLRAAAQRGRSISTGARRTLEEILLDRAREAGVIVCGDGVVFTGEAAFAEFCAAPPGEITPLWWDLRIETLQRSGGWVASATLQLALSEGPPPRAAGAGVFLLGPFVFPRELSAAGAEEEAAREVVAALRSLRPLDRWFKELVRRPGLLRVDPGPEHAASAAGDWTANPRGRTRGAGRDGGADGGRQEDGDADLRDADVNRAPEDAAAKRAAEPPGSATIAEVRAWSEEVVSITDLLLDGEAREAKARVDRLLQE